MYKTFYSLHYFDRTTQQTEHFGHFESAEAAENAARKNRLWRYEITLARIDVSNFID